MIFRKLSYCVAKWCWFLCHKNPGSYEFSESAEAVLLSDSSHLCLDYLSCTTQIFKGSDAIITITLQKMCFSKLKYPEYCQNDLQFPIRWLQATKSEIWEFVDNLEMIGPCSKFIWLALNHFNHQILQVVKFLCQKKTYNIYFWKLLLTINHFLFFFGCISIKNRGHFFVFF